MKVSVTPKLAIYQPFELNIQFDSIEEVADIYEALTDGDKSTFRDKIYTILRNKINQYNGGNK